MFGRLAIVVLGGKTEEARTLNHIGRALGEIRRRHIRDGRPWDLELEALRLLAVSGVHARSNVADLGEPENALLMTYATARHRLAISDSSLRRLVRSGDIPTVNIGGSIRITEADLQAYVATLDRRRGSHEQEEVFGAA
jgi:excisionase family DNA binding protein